MGVAGPRFYDQGEPFARYRAHRGRRDSPNDTLEGPAVARLVGSVRGLRVLDLGCGDASYGRELLDAGCGGYTGLEASRNMCALARESLAGTAGLLVESAIEAWSYPPEAFDLVVSRLALHYVEDFAGVCARAFGTLMPGGRFVFSVEHPVITSCDRGWPEGTRRQDWIVDDYHAAGRRVTRWLGGEVVKYHRTIEDHFVALRQAGFSVDALSEARPERERFAEQETYARRMRIPLFLIVAARKPA
jgi:SAM-dependent methyltransferase